MDLPVLSLRIGSLAPLGPRAVPSGINKLEVAAPIWLGESGFVGDMQGDTAKHGGPEKAVHPYPFEHYAAWSNDLGEHPRLRSPGAFGENIATDGLTEDSVAIGDRFQLGTSIVEVSQGRQPCWRLNERFSRKTMAREVQETGRTGWYCRVIQTGTVGPTDRLTLLERSTPDWTIRRIWRAFYVDTLDKSELRGIADLDRLAATWRNYALRRLESGKVEDWSMRLQGPTS
ncbi:MOSC domain-containing protein [Rhizobium sp. 2MFCol3.1]|uniref:MOSC domain-containing protein n=1 Tax=Rhizobium sp. 2MFCol3.1 TaxID=1246459 RepID=UPI0018CBE2B3|nr:MOSC domain-containing protein [Rhizobium sp. 2MFCol3.1]